MAIALGVNLHLLDPAVAGKGLVGLVHDHQTADIAHGVDDGLHLVFGPQRGGGVVGVGDIGHRRLVLGNCGPHGGHVQVKVLGQLHSHKVQPLQLRGQWVHHKARHGRDHLRAAVFGGLCRGQRQQRDDFVRAIAQQHSAAFGCPGVVAEHLLEHLEALAGIAVDFQRPQTLAQCLLQRQRQAEGVLHGVHLQQALRGLYVIGGHGAHIGANALQCFGLGGRD